MRILNRLPQISLAELDEHAIQYKFYRFLCGGLFVRMQGTWYGCNVMRVLEDGTRFLSTDGGLAGCAQYSFHESFQLIERIEEYK